MLFSGSGSTNTNNEQASLAGSTVISQSISMASSIQRAEADGALPSGADADINLGELETALLAGGYMSGGVLPTLPPPLETIRAVTPSEDWNYTKSTKVVTYGAGPLQVGSTAPDDVLTIKLRGTPDVTKPVCLRINNKLHGTSTVSATTVGGSIAGAAISAPNGANVAGNEGCVDDGTGYTYYKVVNAR